MNWRLMLVLISLGALCACGTSGGRRDNVWTYPEPDVGVVEPAPSSQPVEPQPSARGPTPVPLTPSEPDPSSFPKSPEEISGQAVVSLMRSSNQARLDGQLELAASQLERAQRIEPRNYFVWSALAQVYLEQGQNEQAISVAGKSNSLARGNVFVEIENLKTIVRAKQALGDSIGALRAEARIEEIERTLGGS